MHFQKVILQGGGLFWQKKIKKKIKKIESQLYFQKVILQGGGLFVARKNSKKAKTLVIYPSFSGTVGDTQFQKCPVSSPPSSWGMLDG